MTDGGKRLPARFYQTASGRMPVREWLKGLNPGEKFAIGTDVKSVEYGWPIGMPLCEALDGGLYAIRSKLPTRKTARIIFCIQDDQIVLLHGFIKKNQKIPKQELEIARKRKDDLEALGDAKK